MGLECTRATPSSSPPYFPLLVVSFDMVGRGAYSSALIVVPFTASMHESVIVEGREESRSGRQRISSSSGVCRLGGGRRTKVQAMEVGVMVSDGGCAFDGVSFMQIRWHWRGTPSCSVFGSLWNATAFSPQCQSDRGCLLRRCRCKN